MAGLIYSAAQISVARAFADARRAAGLKQADLSALIGKHQSYISDIERGQRRIDVLELFVIARALKLRPSDFYEKLTADVPENIIL